MQSVGAFHCSEVKHPVSYFDDVVYVCWQNNRLTAAEAIRHPYLSEGRLRYHTCMCSCCLHMPSGAIITAPDLDPNCTEPFKAHFEDDLVSPSTVRGKLLLSGLSFTAVRPHGKRPSRFNSRIQFIFTIGYSANIGFYAHVINMKTKGHRARTLLSVVASHSKQCAVLSFLLLHSCFITD